MKSKLTQTLLSLTTLAFVGCATMPEVKKLNSTEDAPAGTVPYHLPKTEIVVSVPIKKLEKAKAALLPSLKEFQVIDQQAYLKLLKDDLEIEATEVQMDDQTTYALVKKDIAVTSRGVPDENARFVASLNAGKFQELQLTLEFSDEQVMRSAEISVTNNALPVAIKAVGFLASYAEMSGGLALTEQLAQTFSLQSRNFEQFEISRKKYWADLAKLPEWQQPVVVAIARLKSIREIRKRFLEEGSPHKEATQLKAALDWLDEQEKESLGRLIGTVKTTTWVAEVRFTPGDKNAEILKLHEGSGVVAGKGMAGNMSISPFLKPAGNDIARVSEWLETRETFTWGKRDEKVSRLTLTLEQLQPMVPSKDALLGEKGSYVYRQPAKVIAEISLNDTPFHQTELSVAQWGQLRQLPRSLGGIRGGYTVTLDGQTGALKKIVASSKPTDAVANLESLEAIAKERFESRSPTKKLEDEKTFLENKKAVYDLKEYLRKAEEAPTN